MSNNIRKQLQIGEKLEFHNQSSSAISISLEMDDGTEVSVTLLLLPVQILISRLVRRTSLHISTMLKVKMACALSEMTKLQKIQIIG